MPDNSAEIQALEGILNSGATSVTVDGVSTTFDPDAARKRLAELRATDTSDTDAKHKRPRASSINLGGAL